MGAALAIVVVTRETRLQGLKRRWGTARQAAFVLEQAALHERERRQEQPPPSQRRTPGQRAPQPATSLDPEADFAAFHLENERYEQACETIERSLQFGLPVEFIDRAFVPNYHFGRACLVVVVGQDGLVANVAKYVGDLPIVAVNPDPQRIDGVLLPFRPADVPRAARRTLDGHAQQRLVTLAHAQLNDGQQILAFNDLFIGAATHVSARYVLHAGDRRESQSSSGLIVATGAGSTGWFSSIFNMTQGLAAWMGGDAPQRRALKWEDRRLLWAVREPFVSKHSRAELIAGELEEADELVFESLMPTGGVIFSDGMEADALEFNSGSIARVGVARQQARLVVG